MSRTRTELGPKQDGVRELDFPDFLRDLSESMEQAHPMHQHFTVTRGWDELLNFAPVRDIEECHDQHLDDIEFTHLSHDTWVRRRTDATGESKLVKRRCTPTPDGRSLTLETISTRKSKLEKEIEKLVPMAEYDFTRYHLATEGGFELYIDVVRIPEGEGEEYAVVGTIDVREQAKLDAAIELLPKGLCVMPVPSKVYQVLKKNKHPVISKRLAVIALKYEESSFVREDPLRHHKLVPDTDVAKWFATVNRGEFADKYAGLEKEDWWYLSTINTEDLVHYGNNEDTDALLVTYLRAFSHFRYYELAESLRTDPLELGTEDWIRISLHSVPELCEYGNVPKDVAVHMLKQARKNRGY